MNPELIPLDQVRTTLTQLVGALMPLDHGAGSADGIPARASDYVSTIGTRSGYVREFDTSSVGDDPFDAMSHQEIWDKAGTIEPGDVAGSAQNWRALGQTAAEDTVAFAEELSAAISENWQGIAADAARDGVVRYSNSSLALVIASDDLAHKVMDTQTGIAAAKSTLPPPVPYATGEKLIDAGTWVARTLLPGDIKSIQYAHEEAEEAARTVMKTEYAPAIRQAAERVPVLPAAQNPLNGADVGVAGGGSGSYGGGGAGSYGGASSGQSYGSPFGSPGSGTDTAAGSENVPAANPAATAPQDAATRAAGWAPADASGTGNAAGSAGSSGGGSGGPSTSPTAATNPSGGGGSMLAGPGGVAGGSRFGGSGNSSSTGARGGASGNSPRQLGAGGGGIGDAGGGRGGSTPNASGGLAASAGANAGRAGAPGMGGMGGMAPAAGRGGGGDDVHKTPGYLIDAVNGDELVGTLPLVAPPVLGE